MNTTDAIQCALCRRLVPPTMITLHHLLPKERGGKAEHRVPMCRPCHKQIHATFGNKQLEKQFATIDALRAAGQLQRFLKWIARQDPRRNVRTIRARAHPGRG